MNQVFIQLFIFFFKSVGTLFKTKEGLVLENIPLRQQLSIYQNKNTRPRITNLDRSFWVALKQSWKKWKGSLMIVKPETVIAWQKRRFKKSWTKISHQNRKLGRKHIQTEIKDLIYRMAGENKWGAPRIYSELLKLGYSDVSEITVSRYLRKFKLNHPDKTRQQSWKTFLENHRDDISAMDFFTVPTVNFNILFVFCIIDHSRRKLIHYNVTSHPCTKWVMQQLRDAFPYDQNPKCLIMDRDSIFSKELKIFLKENLGINPKVTSYKSPWQNGIAERLILSARTELTNNVIIFNENHLRRLMKEYVQYYNRDRCHLSLGRDSPLGRKVQEKPWSAAKVISKAKLGGLQHRYEWEKSA